MICFALHVKKDVIPFSSDVGVTHVCGECDFCCDVSSFGVLVVVVYIHDIYIYIHLVYIIICITQIVYSPHKPYCVMAWCQWTFLCLGICCVNPKGFEFGSPQNTLDDGSQDLNATCGWIG